MSTKTMSQNIQDILKILTDTVMPTLARFENKFDEIENKFNEMEKRQDRMEKS